VASDPDARAARRAALTRIGRELLTVLGEDPEREGLRGTPARWAEWWADFMEYADAKTDTVFTSTGTDQMVVVKGLRVWSLCEHHLLPFWCDMAIGYIPGPHVIGLSKLGRIASLYAHRLQIQERLVEQVADHVATVAGTEHVAVVAKGEHLCMTMRGIRTPHLMSTSVMRGAFRASGPAREEFFHLSA
jgi:GTP cyclohydrolase IA